MIGNPELAIALVPRFQFIGYPEVEAPSGLLESLQDSGILPAGHFAVPIPARLGAAAALHQPCIHARAHRHMTLRYLRASSNQRLKNRDVKIRIAPVSR